MNDFGMFKFPGPDCPMLKEEKTKDVEDLRKAFLWKAAESFKERSDCDRLFVALLLMAYGSQAKEKLKEMAQFIDALGNKIKEEKDGGEEERP